MSSLFKKKLLLSFFVLSSGFAIDTHAYPNSIKNAHSSWIAMALKLQREIDRDAPLSEATFIGTHNSYNSKNYSTPSIIRYVDPNQTLSIYDQLETGIRSLELDAHWTTNNTLSKDILLCHGQPNHLGCSLSDLKMSDALQELREWLKANPNEIVLLYIDRFLDGHEPRLTTLLEQSIGEFIYKAEVARSHNDDPKGCVALPTKLSKSDILKTGKQLVIVTKGCDGSHPHYEEQDTFKLKWNDYVFSGIGDIPTYPYTFIDSTMDFFAVYPDCGKSSIFNSDKQHSSLWRIYEDRTQLSNMGHVLKKIEPEDMQALTRCGINWPSMDMLNVSDKRLNAAIWSWASSYPQNNQGRCAIYQNAEGIKNTPCDETRMGFACREANTQNIKAVSIMGNWSYGESACSLLGKNWHFIVPVNGYQMNFLKESMTQLSLQQVWLNYAVDPEGHWIANNLKK